MSSYSVWAMVGHLSGLNRCSQRIEGEVGATAFELDSPSLSTSWDQEVLVYSCTHLSIFGVWDR